VEDRIDQTVTLARVDDAIDLWSAIEAAQYGHLFAHHDLGTDTELRALEQFSAAFVELAETWEDTPAENQQSLLRTLETVLALLRGNGLRVHHGVIHHQVRLADGEMLDFPLAIINIGHSDRPELAADIRVDLMISREAADG
jgi:hypothetical protein